jgi:hypothetical protein
MRRAPVVSAMYETFAKATKHSVEFWHAVKVGTGFNDADDPRLRLRTALMSSSTSSASAADKKKVEQEYIYRICITAWNAWRAGDGIKVFRTSKKRQRAK